MSEDRAPQIEKDAAPPAPGTDPGEELLGPLAWARARTPARILVGRRGGSYRTDTWLKLRADHAAARDAVIADLDPRRDFGAAFVERWRLLEIATCVRSKPEFLTQPELGRSLDPPSRAIVAEQCEPGADLQVVIGDGLSAAAVVAQVPALLPRLADEAAARGWRLGRPFLIRHCRVGVLNDIGEILDPTVVVLLIGERPGLATAESLSAYMAYRPRPGDDDSRRNLISNIHARGVPIEEAAARIVRLAEQMRTLGISGVAVKEDSPTTSLGSDPRPARAIPS
ncbi:MAG: ethanolamine ammonia-lyase subunit EutC [Isosphaeraceae bacterium]